MSFFRRNEKRSVSAMDSPTHVGNMLNVLSVEDWNETVFTSADALKNADVLSAIHMVSSDVAGLKIMSTDNEQDMDILDLFNTKPNDVMNGYNLKYSIVANLILDGNVFIEITRNEVGRAIELNLIPQSLVTVKVSRDDYAIKQINYEIAKSNGKTKRVPSNDMLHFKLNSIDGLVGQSPLRALQQELGVEKFSKRFLNNFFKNGTYSGGMLKTEESISDEAIETLKRQFQHANSGMDNAHKVMVIPDGLEYKPLQVDTELIKVVNSNTSSKATIASVLGIPLHKIGLSTSNMSLAQLNQDYLIGTLKSYLDVILAELYKLDLSQILELDFNTDAYKNIDTAQIHENIKIERELGLISVDEARIKLGYKPIGGELGSQYITSLNFVDSSIANDYQLNKGGENNNE